MTRVLPTTLFKTDDAVVIGRPAVLPYKSRFVIQRTTNDGCEWYNAWQQKWFLTKHIHAGSFNNPKASYFRTRERAEEVLAALTSDL